MFRCKIVCMTTMTTLPFIGPSIDDVPAGFTIKMRRVVEKVALNLQGNYSFPGECVPCLTSIPSLPTSLKPFTK